jgi:hypothetical protein
VSRPHSNLLRAGDRSNRWHGVRMRPRHLLLSCLVASALAPAGAPAEALPEHEHRAVLEIGAAAARDLTGASGSGGGTLAVEVTPIENWLELEAGISLLRGAGESELSLDLLFKKPYRLSASSEMMIGLGPEIVRGAHAATSAGVEAVVDLMFWPRRDVGWYVEPGYELVFHHGTRRGLNVAVGLLVGFGH